MASEHVGKLVAAEIVTAINGRDFGLPLEAKRAWKEYQVPEAAENPTAIVIPGNRSSQAISRVDRQSTLTITIVMQQAFEGTPGEDDVPLDRADPIADLAQVVEDYLLSVALTINDNGTTRTARPTGSATSETVDEWLPDSIFAVLMTIEYTLLR